MSVLAPPRWTVEHPTVHRLVREFLLVGVLFVVYNLGRLLAAQDAGAATGNAGRVWSLERWWHLPSEQALQAWVLQWPGLIHAANDFYGHVHFPLTFGVLVFLVLHRPEVYTWVRTALVIATGAALGIAFLYPLAPPRMMTDLGFVDTGVLYDQSVYDSGATGELANQLAAMPSLHVGWALLVAIGMISATRSRWRWLWAAHPVVTTLVVVVTGNHYWLDGIVGIALVLAGVAIARHRAGDRAMSEPTARSATSGPRGQDG